MTAALPPNPELVKRYQAGESLAALAALGHEGGMSRSALARQVLAAGVDLRGRRQAALLRPDRGQPRTAPGTVAAHVAADHFDIDRHDLTDAIREGRVRGKWTDAPNTGRRYSVVLEELAQDSEGLPRCYGEECDRPAIRADGACGRCGAGRRKPRTPAGTAAVRIAAEQLGVGRRWLSSAIGDGRVPATVIRRPGTGVRYHVNIKEAREHLERLGLPRSPEPPIERHCGRCGESLGLLRPYDKRQYCDDCRWTGKARGGEVVTCPGCGKTRYRSPAVLGTGEGWCLPCWHASEGALKIRKQLEERHATITRALLDEGLVPTGAAAKLINWSVSNLPRKVPLERREFGRVVRLGVNALEVVAAAPRSERQRVAGRLNKPLSALHQTHLGPIPLETLRPGTTARISELHESSWNMRAIALDVGVSKSHVQRVIAAYKAEQLSPVPRP